MARIFSIYENKKTDDYGEIGMLTPFKFDGRDIYTGDVLLGAHGETFVSFDENGTFQMMHYWGYDQHQLERVFPFKFIKSYKELYNGYLYKAGFLVDGAIIRNSFETEE